MRKVLVITTEPVPVPGSLTTGAGLRAWGLAQGLVSRGFPVTIGTPVENQSTSSADGVEEQNVSVHYFQRDKLGEFITRINPEVIVMQHWGLVYALPETLPCPLVIDLAGPHLLERQYWGNPDPGADRREKIRALSRADYVTTGGIKQRHYFMPYLEEAGFTESESDIPVIPFSISPETIPYPPAITSPITFIYGGAFLAWQNPEKPIRWLLKEMDACGQGRLLFYGGTHPNLDASGGKFIDLFTLLSNHPRVELRGWKPFAQLCTEYAKEGHIALDLMERNAERELAYTTRTMVYLACGLPVLYNNYSELSELISKSGAGWTLGPDDESSFRKIIRSLLTEPDQIQPMRRKARAAALSQTWDQTIDTLAGFCENPEYRSTKPIPEVPVPTDNKAVIIDEKAHQTRKLFKNPGRIMGILVYIPVLLVCKHLNYTLNVGNTFTRAHKN